MDKNQQESRRRAAQEFKRSLDELEATLRSQPSPPPAAPQHRPPALDQDQSWEDALAEAAQDIERVFGTEGED